MTALAVQGNPGWRPIEIISLAARAFGDLLSRHPGLDRTICAGVIAWEVTFPLVFVLPTPGVVAYLAVGVAFHVGCAVVMGLNRFVWSFCGCYASVWAIAVGW